MSEDPATYYIPQARITQNARGVWVMQHEEYGGSGYTGTLIGPDVLFPEREGITLISGVTADEVAGREMALVPKEIIREIMTALRSAYLHLPEDDANSTSIARIEWVRAQMEAIMGAR